jgi:hypothetical protein
MSTEKRAVRGSGFGVLGSLEVRGSGFGVQGSVSPELTTSNPESTPNLEPIQNLQSGTENRQRTGHVEP